MLVLLLPLVACPAPREGGPPLLPVEGELYYRQIGLGGAALGEAAVLVGPRGQVVLVDVGNDSHDDNVGDVLEELARVAPHVQRGIDHILVTHYHADHGDGVTDLLEHFQLRGSLIHRGVHGLTDAGNGNTADKICSAIAAHGLDEVALCTSPCGAAPDARTCAPQRGHLPLGDGAVLDVLAVDGEIDGARFDHDHGPLLTEDTNGENARSVVALVSFGEMRMLLTGDLTGGGSDTDPVEAFYAPRLGDVSDLDARGVDLLHLGHHGRDSSSSAVWLDALLPNDGCARNAFMGISTAHVGSPHEVVLQRLLDDERLASGSAWTTRVAPFGEDHPSLVEAYGGDVIIRTFGGGLGYFIQALDQEGVPVRTRAYWAVRSRCSADVADTQRE